MKNGQTPLGNKRRDQLAAPLTLLLQAHEHARIRRQPASDFAVEFSELEKVGLSRLDFRLLISHRYVEHIVEKRHQRNRRGFTRVSHLEILKRSCAVLSKKGADWARTVVESKPRTTGQSGPITQDGEAMGGVARPRWDAARQMLLLGGTLVRQFRRPAPRQCLILAIFQERDWPSHLEDPFPQRRAGSAKRRLHETISDLNRGQKPLRVEFHGDGTGRGICWRLRL